MVRRLPPLTAAVSKQMQQMPRASTGPELLVRRELHRRGLRFRVNVRTLPGRPDIVFSRAHLAIFIDGCFWHRCPTHAVSPRNNADWWKAKLQRNVERDAEKDRQLAELGWTVLHYWEHESHVSVADSIESEWRSRRCRPPVA